MPYRSDRRSFLLEQGVAVVGIAGISGVALGRARTVAAPECAADGAWPGFPQQDPALVREMVGAAHGKLDRVKELLVTHPALAKASYDWGYGDWESALGAASHVGNRSIAAILLDHGARLDLFAAAMLGMTDVVKTTLVAQPNLARTRGPHGISLLAHAEAGKNEELVLFLRSVDGAGDDAGSPITPEMMKVYVGSYALPASGGAIVVGETRSGMAIRFTANIAGGTSSGVDRGLVRTGEHTFHPVGAPNVRVTFSVPVAASDGLATRVEIVEAEWLASATRDG